MSGVETPSSGGCDRHWGLQVIDTTFDTYGDIWNPVHNAATAIRYRLDRHLYTWPSSIGRCQRYEADERPCGAPAIETLVPIYGDHVPYDDEWSIPVCATHLDEHLREHLLGGSK